MQRKLKGWIAASWSILVRRKQISLILSMTGWREVTADLRLKSSQICPLLSRAWHSMKEVFSVSCKGRPWAWIVRYTVLGEGCHKNKIKFFSTYSIYMWVGEGSATLRSVPCCHHCCCHLYSSTVEKKWKCSLFCLSHGFIKPGSGRLLVLFKGTACKYIWKYILYFYL